MKVDSEYLLQRPFFMRELNLSVWLDAPDNEILDSSFNGSVVAHLGVAEMEHRQFELRKLHYAVAKYTKKFLDNEQRLEKFMSRLANNFMTRDDSTAKEKYNHAVELQTYYFEMIDALGKLQRKIGQIERTSERAIQQQYREEFAASLKNTRLRRGMSQKELASRLGIATPSLSQYENAVIEPSLKNLMRLSKILDVSTDELLCNSKTN